VLEADIAAGSKKAEEGRENILRGTGKDEVAREERFEAGHNATPKNNPAMEGVRLCTESGEVVVSIDILPQRVTPLNRMDADTGVWNLVIPIAIL
jgi:hypothetical protein